MKRKITKSLPSTSALLRTEQMIAFVLRYGVILCAVIISTGLVLRLYFFDAVGHNSGMEVQDLTSGVVLKVIAVPQSVKEFRLGLMSANPDVIISLGLWLLILLPVLRVAMTVVLFMVELDWVYLGITSFVFLVLMSSILMGKSI
jgi:uncharacterized membrane protein